MIAYLAGLVLFRGSNYIIIDVSGVGYKVFSSPEVFKKCSEVGKQCKVFIHMHVRENSQDLFGFLTLSELEFFEMLISVPGIGPKSAIGVLSLAPIDTLKKAISAGETNYLMKISGIGKKTAEKMIVELREKLSGGVDVILDAGEADVFDALVSLGYSVSEAREAINKVSKSAGSVDEKIKQALKLLGS